MSLAHDSAHDNSNARHLDAETRLSSHDRDISTARTTRQSPENGENIALPDGRAARAAPARIAPPPLAPIQQSATDLSAAAPRLPALSSRFGYRRDPINGATRMHSGIDIPGALGSSVMAAESGQVTYSGNAGGYGNMIEIQHKNETVTRYAHLSRTLVQVGEAVTQGQVIGRMGATGRATGSHLHFEVRAHGQPTDPLPYLSGNLPISLQSIPPLEPHVSRFAQRINATHSAPASPCPDTERARLAIENCVR